MNRLSEVRGPLVVCVSDDIAVRERLVRQLDDLGPLVLCADLAELRAMLFPGPSGFAPGPSSPVPAASSPGPLPSVPGPLPPPPVPAARSAAGPVRLGALVVDPAAHLVTWRGQALALTRLERELIARLASPPMMVWSYERLFGSVWGGAYLGDSAILHSAVKRLRRKLRAVEGGPRIHTVRGVGYRLSVGS